MVVVEFMRLNWGWLLSFAGVLFGAIAFLNARIKALKRGLQALLRAEMIAEYNHYSEKGFAPIYAKDNFENLWKQYEALWKNGVMGDLHKRFMALPTRES